MPNIDSPLLLTYSTRSSTFTIYKYNWLPTSLARNSQRSTEANRPNSQEQHTHVQAQSLQSHPQGKSARPSLPTFKKRHDTQARTCAVQCKLVCAQVEDRGVCSPWTTLGGHFTANTLCDVVWH